MESSDTETVTLATSSEPAKEKKKTDRKQKAGVVYLSCIPRCMTLARLREEMEQYGETGNIFLEPDERAPYHPYQTTYKEGWVEFRHKAVAKQVAATLNNTQVGGKRKNPWRDDIWNIKYLPKFQWIHLNARRAYEQGIYKQRLQAELEQIKRDVAFDKQNYKKSQILKKKRKQQDAEETESLAKKVKREYEGEKKKKQRERTKRDRCRPDGNHAVGAMSLAANKELMCKLFSGGDS